MPFPQHLLPGYYVTSSKTGKSRFVRNKRLAKLINDYHGRLVKYRDLPVECQLAMAYYMAIDGEAWTAPQEIYNSPHLTTQQQKDAKFRHSIPHFVEHYGNTEFGFIPALPIAALIGAVMQDADLKNDYVSWEAYNNWYLSRGTKYQVKANSPPWPVILSSFKDETLEDGWSRFHQYAQQQLPTIPALFYPYTTDKEFPTLFSTPERKGRR
jgi:hypothetical protein